MKKINFYDKIKSLIPRKVIRRYEAPLRKIVSMLYVGNNYSCNICGFKMSRFIGLENHDLLCPKCGSLSRTRRLWSFLEGKIQGKKILHFSPSKSIRTKLELIPALDYETSDYAGEFKAKKTIDIESINEPNNNYDLIVCYHILEHIKNDVKAMKELLRVLKPGGVCVIQTPFKEGGIYEDDSIKTAEERLIHFGQQDHLRIYSVDGLVERLRNVGFNISVVKYTEKANNKNGYDLDEKIILAEKSL